MSSNAVCGMIFMIGCAIFVVWYLLKIDKDEKESEEQSRQCDIVDIAINNELEYEIKVQEEIEKIQEKIEKEQEESFETAIINRIKRFIKNNIDLFNSLKYIFDSAKDLYEKNLWCWNSLTLSYGPSIELIYSVETNKFYIGYSYGSWSAYIDSCFSENNLIFFSKTREFKSGYGFKTTIKNNLNYHTLYSMLKDLKENIEYILYNFKSYTEED